jgi:hypothetical protein
MRATITIALAAASLFAPASAYALTCNVTTVNPVAQGSLGACITQTNNTPNQGGPDVIDIDPTLVGMITPAIGYTITDSVTIHAHFREINTFAFVNHGTLFDIRPRANPPGPPPTVILYGAVLVGQSGNIRDHAIAVADGCTVDLQGSVIEGFADLGPNGSGGAAIRTTGGSIWITDSRLHGNAVGASLDGGAVYVNDGALVVVRSELHDNVAHRGGAVALLGSSEGDLIESTFSTNTATNRTLSPAGKGGAVYVGGNASSALLITYNATYHDNSASKYGKGGHVYVDGGASALLMDATLSSGHAFAGGALNNEIGSTVDVYDTILEGRSIGSTCRNLEPLGGFGNLSIDESCAFQASSSVVVGATLFGSFGYHNGGSTRTLPLGAGSKAHDNGDPAACFPTDQNGVVRNAFCDIGAYEIP